MASMLRRPILISGLGLTSALWLLEILHPVDMSWAGMAVWAAIALGGLWWLKQQAQKPLDLSLSAQPVDRTVAEAALVEVETLVSQLASEAAATSPDTALSLEAKFRSQLANLTTELDRKEVRLAIVGGKAVGKSALMQALATNGLPKGSPDLPARFSLSDTPALFGENADQSKQVVTAVVNAADLVLFVTAGDLTCSEFDTLQQWVGQQRLLLIFNKQDQYLPTERPLVLQQLRQRVQAYLAAEDVVAIAAQPAAVKVRQYQPDGLLQERQEQPDPDFTGLTERLGQVLTQAGQPLIMATVWRQAKAVKTEVITAINYVRRDRALPVIEQYQWIAAAAAFANPFPSLDLVATAAINAQLVLDLGAIYQQQFSLDQSKTTAKTMASLMIKLGLVEFSSQAIAPLLKSSALTYVAGGMLQGVSAAYLTRVAGLSLVAYFEEQSQIATTESGFQVDRLSQKLKAVFQDNQRIAFLQALVKQGMERFTSSQERLNPTSI
jgi:uncharacterized protein